uniref:TetR/AcrR family transcriptional regulator n=1 Tax=Roseihalotalea indica TaxID=2867963 RepID=A0AA49GQX5_9BACT|nr:TetR/AcrR family transcriptional regulator [Tunicatimonas sp. TK19036]
MKDTKQLIIDAAIPCFNRDESVTLEIIAASAGVSRRTLHRYFNDRQELIECCKEEMLLTCNTAMLNAYHSSDKPLVKLEQMLYAAVDSGSKYSFLKKLYQRSNYAELDTEKAFEYDDVKSRWFRLVAQLQAEGIISHHLTIPWIFNLFGGIIDATITALESGDVAPNDIKKFSWFSFKGSIGIKNEN